MNSALTCNSEALLTVTVYNKLFTKILDSSIWLESDTTRIVWFTFLAAMDETGFAQFASVGNLANRARVSIEAAKEAVEKLSSPDPDSSDQDNEGRRIERVEGGWIVLNAEKYRELVTRAVAQERTRLRVARYRARNAGVTPEKRPSNGHVTQSEAETESETEIQSSSLSAQERKPLFDALVKVTGIAASEVTPKIGARLGRVLREIHKSTPKVTASEIEERAANYHRKWPNVDLTPEAFLKHWAALGGKAVSSDAEARLNAF